MNIMMLVVMLLGCCGCFTVTREIYTEGEICSLCCKFCNEKWRHGGFQNVAAKDAGRFISRMFRDREFSTCESLNGSYDSQDMTRKLSCGEARGFYAKSDEQEIFLYVDLKKEAVEIPDEMGYDCYSYDYFVYNVVSNSIDCVGCSSVDNLQLDLERSGYE